MNTNFASVMPPVFNPELYVKQRLCCEFSLNRLTQCRYYYSMRIFLMSFLMFTISHLSYAEESARKLTIADRTPQIRSFPCSKCHRNFKPENFGGHNAKEHAGIFFKHMPEVKNCTLCHSTQRPDQLNLQDGTLISYNENPKLCGQCHGKIAFQWELGRHGKDVGSWGGDKTRWTCTECHHPHAPKFPSMDSVAQPHESPYVIKKEKEHHE